MPFSGVLSHRRIDWPPRHVRASCEARRHNSVGVGINLNGSHTRVYASDDQGLNLPEGTSIWWARLELLLFLREVANASTMLSKGPTQSTSFQLWLVLTTLNCLKTARLSCYDSRNVLIWFYEMQLCSTMSWSPSVISLNNPLVQLRCCEPGTRSST